MSKREEFKRAWWVLLPCGVGSCVSATALTQYTLGTFMLPLSQEFGWTHSEVGSFLFSKSIAMFGASFFVGILTDRFGARRVALSSQVLLVLGLAGMSLLPGYLWVFFLGYGGIVLIGAGTLPMVWTKVIIGWFRAGRGLALGLGLMLTGALGAITPTYTTWLIQQFGWREAYVGLALLPLFLGVPLTYFLLREPLLDSPGESGTAQGILNMPGGDIRLREAIRTLYFWQMTLAFFLAIMGVLGTLVHAVPLLISRSVSPITAAAIFGLFGVASSTGRLVTGALLDFFRPEHLVGILFLLPAVACIILTVAGNNLFLCGAGIALIGFTGGTEADAISYLVAHAFGKRDFSAISGLIFAASVGAGGVSPIIAGSVYDHTHSYNVALWGASGLFILAALLMMTLRLKTHSVTLMTATLHE